MPQGTAPRCCHWFFPSQAPRTPDGSSSKSQPGGAQDPGAAAASQRKSRPVGTSVSALHEHDATRPSVALWTKAAPCEGFSYTHLEVRIFLTTAVAARGREGSFIYSHSFYWAFWNYRFSQIFLWQRVSLSLPSSKALLPQAASQEVITILPEYLLALFFFFFL